jgi:hypothetical protein
MPNPYKQSGPTARLATGKIKQKCMDDLCMGYAQKATFFKP